MKTMIRSATTQDVNRIYQMICELEEEQFDFALFEKYYYQNIDLPDNIYLVAVENDQIIGFLSCHGQLLLHHCGMAYEIQELFVDKDFRGNGIGKLLLEKLKEELKDRDPKILEVTSGIKRKEAHDFYERNGFVRSHFKFTANGH
jgi:(aminoalkyl)phosphonate N-acetyltransferase